MDIEWGKDGQTGELFILQARPETVHSNRKGAALRIYRLTGKGEQLAQGLAVGEGIAVGQARVIGSPRIRRVQRGRSWSPRAQIRLGADHEDGRRDRHRAGAGLARGPSSHASWASAVLGSPDAMRKIPSGETVTLSCARASRAASTAGRSSTRSTSWTRRSSRGRARR